MDKELKKLIDKSYDLSIKIRFALDYLEKAPLDGGNHFTEALKNIIEWQEQLEELNKQIIALWKSSFPDP